MRLSKTRVRHNSLDCQEERLSVNRPEVASLALDRRSRVYGALLHQALDFTQGSTWAGYLFDSPQWVLLFEENGINVNILKQQRIAWLADEAQASRQLRLRFSLETLVGCGLFDPDGEFRFARHRILVPFRSGKEVTYFIGMDCELGFADLLSPTPSWPAPYRVPDIDPVPLPRRLYLTPELRTALRLGALGYSAWAVQSLQQLATSWLERLRDREVVFCLDKRRMESRAVEPYQKLLEGHCTRFRWQTLGQAETEWLVVQSREERAQPIEGQLRFQKPEPQFLSRIAKAFRRKGGSLRQLFSR